MISFSFSYGTAKIVDRFTVSFAHLVVSLSLSLSVFQITFFLFTLHQHNFTFCIIVKYADGSSAAR